MKTHARNFNLDVIRAAAVTMVVLSHIAVMSPMRRPWALTASWIGQFGVDLFFVLSGWLIGGLFWAERAEFGSVQWGRFFSRRALRTMPPYFVALPFAWLAVRLFAPGHPAFDPHYLVFLQNYEPNIPYYAISWSLCVEEHFYLLFPALVLGVIALRLPPAALFAVLLAVSPLCRILIETNRDFNAFDRSVFATHLRLEGLVLGFWAAYARARQDKSWELLMVAIRWAWAPALVLLALTPAIPGPIFYCWGPTLIAALFLVFVTTAATAAPWALPFPWAFRWLAGTSYSIYLIHSLLIHVARVFALHRGQWAEIVYWLAALLLIGGTGWMFSRAVEVPCIRWRDRLVPRRVSCA